MGRNFLFRQLLYHAKQRCTVMVHVICFAVADTLQVIVGIRRILRIAVIGFQLGAEGKQFFAVLCKQETHGGKGGMDAIGVKEIQQAWNHFAYAPDVGAITFNGTLVAYAPQKLKVKRNDEPSFFAWFHVCLFWT